MSTQSEQPKGVLGYASKHASFNAVETYTGNLKGILPVNQIIASCFIYIDNADGNAYRVDNTVTTDTQIIGVAQSELLAQNDDYLKRAINVTRKGYYIPVLTTTGVGSAFNLGDPVYVDVATGLATNVDGGGTNILVLNAKVSGASSNTGFVKPPADLNGNTLTSTDYVYIDLT